MTKPAPWTFTPAGRRILELRGEREFANAARRLSLKRAQQDAQRRKAAEKPRQRVRPRSAVMDAAMARYMPIRDKYLALHPICECSWFGAICTHPATDVHHTRGKLGELRFDPRWFLATCRACHSRIDARRDDARKNGLLAQRGEWNTQSAATTKLADFTFFMRKDAHTVKRISLNIPVAWDAESWQWLVTPEAHCMVEDALRKWITENESA